MAFIDKMKGQDYIEKTREYLDYLEQHLRNVQHAFTEISDACKDMAWVSDDFSWHTLRAEVEYHDLSKFSKEEFVQYRDSFFPVTEKDKANSGMDAAWENHKRENHHHHETAENYLDIVHMVIDWTAMGYKFGDTAQLYYESNKEKIKLSDDHVTFMYEIFGRLKASCEHKNKTGMDWPDGGYVEVCQDCGKSRHLWEQGESSWIMVDDIEKAKKEVQDGIDQMCKRN